MSFESDGGWRDAVRKSSRMEAEGFDPLEGGRPSRAEAYYFTGMRFRHLLQRRGDQRVGQLVLNALANEGFTSKQQRADALWGLELPELCDIIENYLDEVVNDE